MPKILVKRVQEDEYAAEIGQDSREDEYMLQKSVFFMMETHNRIPMILSI